MKKICTFHIIILYTKKNPHVLPFFQGNFQGRVNAQEARIFWLALVLCPLLWGIFFIVALFGLKFKWLVSKMFNKKFSVCQKYFYENFSFL